MLGEAKDISGILPIIVSKHITLVTFNLSYQSLKKIKVQPQQKFHRVTNQILTCIVYIKTKNLCFCVILII